MHLIDNDSLIFVEEVNRPFAASNGEPGENLDETNKELTSLF